MRKRKSIEKLMEESLVRAINSSRKIEIGISHIGLELNIQNSIKIIEENLVIINKSVHEYSAYRNCLETK